MSNRARGRSRRRILLASAVLGGLSVLLGACSSGNAASTSSSSGSASINLAPFEQALQADYKGHFTAPPTTAPPHKKGVNLWIISCGQASEGCSQPVANAKEAAQLLGWKATVFDGNFGIGDAYNNGIRQAIADHAQAIITIGVNCNQAKSGYQAAKAAGIVVVGGDSYDCSDPAVHDGANVMSATVEVHPGVPHRRGHLARARHRQGRLDHRAHQGPRPGDQHRLRRADRRGVLEPGLRASWPSARPARSSRPSRSPADTSDGTLKQEWASALAQFPNANAGVIISDGIVIQDGMAQAIQSAGRTKTFSLVSGEGYAPNVAMIRAQNGEDAVTPFDSNWLAWGAVDTVIRLLDHQPACTREWVCRSWTGRITCPQPASSTTPREVPGALQEGMGRVLTR